MRMFTDEEIEAVCKKTRIEIISRVVDEVDAFAGSVRREDRPVFRRLHERIVGLLAAYDSPTGDQSHGGSEKTGGSARLEVYSEGAEVEDGKGSKRETAGGREIHREGPSVIEADAVGRSR